MAQIVLIGHDEDLLVTRAAVLRKTGSSVTYFNAREADALFKDHAFDIVVLCHTLGDIEVAELIGKVHRLWPRAKILKVVVGFGLEYSMKDGDVSSCADPGRLILKTKQLLEDFSDHRLQLMSKTVDPQVADMADGA
jgi:hypothetical protein